MTALAQNTSITLTLQDGGLVSISTNGGLASVTATPTGGATQSQNLGPLPVRVTVGPFSEGASVTIYNQNAVLDYDRPGGNIATISTDPLTGVSALVAGGGEYPLSGQSFIWATKPAAAGNTGLTIRVTDVGASLAGSHWVSDGTYWRPVGGSVLLGLGSGSIAAPIQSLTGTTGATFTAAQVNIPAGLLIPGAQIELWAHCRRVGANGTANFNAAIGTAGGASDANIFGFSMAATNNLDVCPSPMIDVHSATGINTTNWLQTAGTSGGSSAADTTANFNVASAMKVSLYTSSANALDAFNLIKYRLRAHF